MHLHILPEHQKLFFSKEIFVFWCICTYFQNTRNFFSKEIFFTVWSGYKRVFMHLRILPDHQKPFFKRDIFERLGLLKTCFDAFAHTSRPPETFFEKRYYWKSGVVKNVFLCICAYFQITRSFFSKKIYSTVLSG